MTGKDEIPKLDDQYLSQFRIDSPTNWESRFMRLTREISTWSKDPSTKVGALAVKGKNIVQPGYNGFPRGIMDSETRLNNREKKYELVIHAEENVIHNSLIAHNDLSGATIFVYGLPTCVACAIRLINVQIDTVIVRKQDLTHREPWASSWLKSVSLFEEAGVIYRIIDLPLEQIV